VISIGYLWYNVIGSLTVLLLSFTIQQWMNRDVVGD